VIIPPPSAVLFGIPTDATVGTLETSIETSALEAAVATVDGQVQALTGLPEAVVDLEAVVATIEARLAIIEDMQLMPDYLVERLNNVATVESTGAQIAALCSTP
jgi:hypothetical protein